MDNVWSSNINELAQQITEWSREYGIVVPPNIKSIDSKQQTIKILCDILDEVREAMMALANDDRANFVEELMDVLISTMNLAKMQGVDIHSKISWKMDINLNRPKRSKYK